MHRATAVLPLHGGRAPAWLYQRMVRLAKPFVRLSVEEHGVRGMLQRLGSPTYLQALGSLMGFDWHASGLTTTTTSALRDAFNAWPASPIRVAGGKGRTALKTPDRLAIYAREFGLEPARFQRASRVIAKVDSALVQDNARLYHHTFFLAEDGAFTVIQQGMDTLWKEARRYHWYVRGRQSFTREPHSGLTRECDKPVMNLTLRTNQVVQQDVLLLLEDTPVQKIQKLMHMLTHTSLRMPSSHELNVFFLRKESQELLKRLEEDPPMNMTDLLLRRRIGPRMIRALTLTASLLYGTPIDYADPAVYAFAHGGKDGTPFPVDRRTYDATIHMLETATRSALEGREQRSMLKRLAAWAKRVEEGKVNSGGKGEAVGKCGIT